MHPFNLGRGGGRAPLGSATAQQQVLENNVHNQRYITRW